MLEKHMRMHKIFAILNKYKHAQIIFADKLVCRCIPIASCLFWKVVTTCGIYECNLNMKVTNILHCSHLWLVVLWETVIWKCFHCIIMAIYCILFQYMLHMASLWLYIACYCIIALYCIIMIIYCMLLHYIALLWHARTTQRASKAVSNEAIYN